VQSPSFPTKVALEQDMLDVAVHFCAHVVGLKEVKITFGLQDMVIETEFGAHLSAKEAVQELPDLT
jgi:hypothetical protein